jgi:predicted dehydrogenase
MPSLADLHRTIDAAVASGRIGRPVFVRYFWQGPDAPDCTRPEMPAPAAVTGMVADWLGEPADRLYVLGSRTDRRRHVALAVQCRNGATALITCVRAPTSASVLDVMVLGNRGAIYYNDGSLGMDAWQPNPTGWENRHEPWIVAALEDAREQQANPVEVRQRSPVSIGGKLVDSPASSQTRPAGRLPRHGILLVTGSRTHQEDYAAAFAGDDRCRIVAVTDQTDIDPQRRVLNERLARVLAVPYLPDLNEALALPDVHAVSVCAPPERRGRIALRCAEAGKHLYLDKPLVPSLREADALVAAVKRAGVRSHMFSFITQPWAREAKQLIEAGQLGDLLGIHADVFFAKGRTATARNGTPRREEFPPRRQQLPSAKRELDNVGVYPITLVRWLTGRRFGTVFGITANYFFAEHQQHNVEDFGLLACTLEDGLPVTIAAGRCGWTSHPASGVHRMILIGSKRTVVIDANRPRLEICTDEPPWQPPAIHPDDPMSFWTSSQEEAMARPKRNWLPVAPPGQSDAAYFLDCLDSGRDSEMSVAEAALATEVLLAGYRSATSGEVVALPLARGTLSVRE